MKNAALIVGFLIVIILSTAVFAAPLSGTIQIVGSTTIQPLAEELAQEFMDSHKDVKIFVQGGGSGAGVKAATEGTADIGTCSRELEPAEAATGIVSTVIAKDGIAIIANKANTVRDLTTEQIQKIFAGTITNWKEAGGPDMKIVVVNREPGSGTRTAFEELVLKPAKLTNTSKCLVQGSTGAMNQTVAVTKEAIGYTSLADMDTGTAIKALTVNKVAVNVKNILAKKYPLQRPLLMLTKAKPKGVVKGFLDWVASSAGQKIVLQNNFIAVK